MKKLLFLLTLISSGLFALNLNTATMQELTQIKGIGPKKAKAIIDYRKKHKIKSVDDLKNIKGFNKKIISNIKNNVLNKNKSKNPKKIKKQLKKNQKNKFQKKIKNQKNSFKKTRNKKKKFTK